LLVILGNISAMYGPMNVDLNVKFYKRLFLT
jgi:hypothetical protein